MTLRRLWPVGVLLGVVLAVPAVAASTTAQATWTFGGASQAYTGTMSLPATGFPAAGLASDSGNFANLGLQSGAAMWFGATTPPGQVFGSSQNQPYLNLRTRSDAGPGVPSATTYTFAAGTPAGWGLVLGDVDADRVQLSGTTASGAPLSGADLGFQSTFNMCTTSPKPSGCGTNDTDVPTWNAGTSTLVGSGTDTNGAAGWFRPTVPVRTLTLTFSRISGAPSYQTWFAVRRQDLTGTVSSSGQCDLTASRVSLVGPDGSVLAATSPDADGHYAFAAVAAGAGYVARLDAAPPGCQVSGPGSAAVDLSAGDAVADFAVLRPAPLGTVHGSVQDTVGDPVPSAVLHLGGDGVQEQTSTDADGEYRLPPVPAGSYDVTLDPPGGLTVVGRSTRHVRVAADGQMPRLDFQVKRPTATTVATTTPSTPTVGALPEVGSPVPWWTPPLGLVLVLVGVSSSAPRWRRRSRPVPAAPDPRAAP